MLTLSQLIVVSTLRWREREREAKLEMTTALIMATTPKKIIKTHRENLKNPLI